MDIASGRYEIESVAPLKKETLFIGALTSGGSTTLGTKMFEILVCGYEAVLTPKGKEINEEKKTTDEPLTYDLK